MTIDRPAGSGGPPPSQPSKKPSIGKRRVDKGKGEKDTPTEVARKSLPEPESISSPHSYMGREIPPRAKKRDIKGKGEKNTPTELARKSLLKPGPISAAPRGHMGGYNISEEPTKPAPRKPPPKPLSPPPGSEPRQRVAPPAEAGPAAAASPVEKEIKTLRNIIKEIDQTNKSLDIDIQNDLQVLTNPDFLQQFNPDKGFIEAFKDYCRVNNQFTIYFSALSPQLQDLTPEELKNVIQNLCSYFSGEGYKEYKNAVLGVALLSEGFKTMLDSNKKELDKFLAGISYEDSRGQIKTMSRNSFSTYVRVGQRMPRFTLFLEQILKNINGLDLSKELVEKAHKISKEYTSWIDAKIAVNNLQPMVEHYKILIQDRSSKTGAAALKSFEKELYTGTLRILLEKEPLEDLDETRLGLQTTEKALIDLFLESKVRRHGELTSKWRRTPEEVDEMEEIIEILKKGTKWS